MHVRFERSDTLMGENVPAFDLPHVPAAVILGPFNQVRGTYNSLEADGERIAFFSTEEGTWFLATTSPLILEHVSQTNLRYGFSDFAVY